MTTDLEKAQANIEFYTQVAPLELELEEARVSKGEDPERWFAAKQAFEEQRTFYREIGEYIRAVEEAETAAAVAVVAAEIAAEIAAAAAVKAAAVAQEVVPQEVAAANPQEVVV